MNLTIEELGILSSYTRRKILKILSEKRETVTGVSSIMGRSKSSVHEHLSKLAEKGFVTKIGREGHKDVYYEVSGKGNALLRNEPAVIALTSVFLLAGISGAYSIMRYFYSTAKIASPMIAEKAAGREGIMAVIPEASEKTIESVQASLLWLAFGLGLLIIAALAVYMVFGKRQQNA